MAVKNIEEARNIALEKRPGMRVVDEFEEKDCYVINLVPEKYDESKHVLFIGGSTRVDKHTGEIRLYNPLTEGVL